MMPALETDKESLKEVVAQMYDEHGEDAIFSIFDWHCNSAQKLEIYHSKRKKETYGVNSHERLLYYEKIPPWKIFPKLKKYEKITLDLVIMNADGIADDLVMHGKRINERYSYALFKLREEEPSPRVQETPKAHHKPILETMVEEEEPQAVLDIPTFTEETRERRRGAELDVDDGDAHFLGYARYGAYLKTWEEKAEERPFHKKTFAIVFLAAACLALLQVMVAPYLPQFVPFKKGSKTAWLHHLIAIVPTLIIAYKATFVRPTHLRDVSLFVATTALFFWVDTGSLVHFTLAPAMYCCVAVALALFYYRRPFVWVPFVVLVVYIVLTHTSVVNTCLAVPKLIVVGVSMTHEQRQGSKVGTILFAPYRDLLFVFEFPFVYILEFLEALDLI